jgi:hypothetical protein
VSACKGIEEEYDHKNKIDSARTDKVIAKRTKQYEEAQSKAVKSIDTFDTFLYLHHRIITELKPFRGNGELRDRKHAEGEIQARPDLTEELGNKKINKTAGQTRRILPNLPDYLDIARKVVAKLDKLPFDQNALSSLCLARRWHKAGIKAKKAERRNKCVNKEQFCLDFSEGYFQEDFEIIKERVYKKSDRIVQSTALVATAAVSTALLNSSHQLG